MLVLTTVPVICAGAIPTGALSYGMPRAAGRFTPPVHLPAFGILLLGLLLLPTALGREAGGPVGPAAFLSCVTPGAALAWIWCSSFRLIDSE